MTCNYVARDFGVEKLQLLSEALKRCPELVIRDGSDLTAYRRASQRIFMFVKTLLNGPFASDDSGKSWIVPIERLGMDELYIDVTRIVLDHLEKTNLETWPDGQVVFAYPSPSSNGSPWSSGFSYSPESFAGHLLGSSSQDPLHDQLLQIASHLATNIRKAIHSELGYTSSAGVSYNKLLSKLCGSLHKPNDQTCLLPGREATAFLDALPLCKIPGIGHAMRNKIGAHLQAHGGLVESNDPDVHKPDLKTRTVGEIKTVLSLEDWAIICGKDESAAIRFYNLLQGEDTSSVTSSGLPSQISLEDSFQTCTTLVEAETHLLSLSTLLVQRTQEEESGESKGTWRRYPKTVRLTIRRKSTFDRESRSTQVPVDIYNDSLSCHDRAHILVTKTLLPTLKRMLGSKDFNLSLFNISFCDFGQDRHSKSISSYFGPATKVSDVLMQVPAVTKSHDAPSKRKSADTKSSTKKAKGPMDRFLKSNKENSEETFVCPQCTQTVSISGIDEHISLHFT